MTRRAYVHRIPADAPDDVSALEAGFASGEMEARAIVAILGKTEGNGCVNDFSRGLATRALGDALGAAGADPARVCMVMSGGTEGALAPHFVVFEAREVDEPAQAGALAVGRARTPAVLAAGLGRLAQVDLVTAGVRAAMRDAGLERAQDVHFVQIKCPLLTAGRMAKGDTVTRDTLKSMGLSRAASALGAGVARRDRAGTAERGNHRAGLLSVLQPRFGFGGRRA